MPAQNILHMNVGTGESSYANNSILQKTVIQKARHILDEAIKDMCNNITLPNCLNIADLGCASGPNTLLVISEIMDVIHHLCQQNNQKPPEFQVFLNDLPDNDFNTIFKTLQPFYDKLKKEKGDAFGRCFILGLPGSFYSRLFPSKSLHFVHSSYSVHWLSQVPEKLETNKRNIYMGKTSPPKVFEAYSKQFKEDFSAFLRLRSDEMMPGGRMVLTFIGRSIADPTTHDCRCIWELLTSSLLDMVAKGLVKETDIDSFNLPFYTPCKDEVDAVIQEEQSFNLDKLECFQVNWDATDNDEDKDYVFDKFQSGENVAKCIKAVTEPIFASHFGPSIIEDLFEGFSKHVAEHLSMEKTKFFNITISLRKK